MKKVGAICLIVAAILIFLIWLFVESSKPLPGTKITDLGREHVPIGENIEYNSNPPTSGKHYADWIRSGVYNNPKDDRNLVHSLEHGYVIMHYKCDQIESHSEATEAGKLDESCELGRNQLAKIHEQKGRHKLIVVPRPNLDTNYALTAWQFIDTFNEFNKQRVIRFIDAHLNQGPEKTMEQ